MKRSLYNMALAICTAAAMYSCSLDEYNPSDTSGEGELKTVEGLKNLGTYCYSPLYDQMFSASDYLAVAEPVQIYGLPKIIKQHCSNCSIMKG